MFITPIVGVVTFIWHGRILDFGLFRLDFGVPSNRAVFRPTEGIHGYLAYALFALAGMQAAAALWHFFFLRNGVWGRVGPLRAGSATPGADNVPAGEGRRHRRRGGVVRP